MPVLPYAPTNPPAGTAVSALTLGSRRRWLARRRRGITATDVPALLGMSPWATPLSVWLDKHGRGPDITPSYAMLKGSTLEPLIAAKWAEASGETVYKPPLLIANRRHPIMLASVDYLTADAAGLRVLEVKTSNQWEEWSGGRLPDMYAAQVLWQLAVTELDEAVVYADVAGRFHERVIPRDLDWEAEVIPRLLAWWDMHVVGGELPPLDMTRDYPLLNRVWEPDPAVEAVATDAVLTCVERARAVAEERARLDDILTAHRTHIRAAMADATTLLDRDNRPVARIAKNGRMTVLPPKKDGATA